MLPSSFPWLQDATTTPQLDANRTWTIIFLSKTTPPRCSAAAPAAAPRVQQQQLLPALM